MINQVMEKLKERINTEYISPNQLDILKTNNDKLHSLITLNMNMIQYITANVRSQIVVSII